MAEITETLYIESATSLQAQLIRVNQIIEALENQILNVATGNSDVAEYQLDDGQVKIRTQYRSITAIYDGIHAFERKKQMILNKLNGRGMALRDAKAMN